MTGSAYCQEEVIPAAPSIVVTPSFARCREEMGKSYLSLLGGYAALENGIQGDCEDAFLGGFQDLALPLLT